MKANAPSGAAAESFDRFGSASPDGASGNIDPRALRVAVVLRALNPYRVPILQKLSREPGVTLRVLHGQTIRGTKIKSAKDVGDLDRRELWTLAGQVRSTGRRVPMVVSPGLVSALFSFRPTIILAEGASNIVNNIAVFAYVRFFGVPVVWWSLGELPGRTYSGLSRVYKSFAARQERRSSGFLGYSSQACDYFRRMGYDERAIYLAVNNVDTDRAGERGETSAADVAPLREKLGGTDRFIVLFVGALDPVKRVDRLIRAVAIAAKESLNLSLVIVGGGGEREALEALAEREGVSDRTTFTGEVRDGVAAYFLAADAFALPGLGGLAIPEAMTHGLPVVCTTADGTEHDFLTPGETGEILPGGDDEAFIEALAGTLRDWSSDPQRVREMGERARRVIDEKHNTRTFVASILHALRDTARRHRESIAQARG